MICAYHDHADEEEVETSPISEKDAEAESSTSSEQVFFPVKLHTMLTHMGKEGADNVAGWAPHGRCFLIRDKEAFVSSILTSWFRQSKFASFQRQLNLYGFKRITTGPDKGAYYHELFLRSKIFLCNRMERVKIKGSKPGRIKAYADTEPDFYRMRPMPSEDVDAADHDPGFETVGQDGPLNIASAIHSTESPNETALTNSTGQLHVLDITRPGNLLVGSSHSISSGQSMLMPSDFRQLSFFAGQPQPVSIARSSPHTGSHLENDQREECSTSRINANNTLDALFQSNIGSRPAIGNQYPLNASMQGRNAEIKENDLLSGRSNHGGLLSIGARNNHGNAHQSIGTSLSESILAQQLQPPPLSEYQVTSAPQEPAQPDPLSYDSLDTIDVPDDLLTEVVPTAQSLVLENLFEQDLFLANASQSDAQPYHFPPRIHQTHHSQSLQYDPIIPIANSNLDRLVAAPSAAHKHETGMEEKDSSSTGESPRSRGATPENR